MELTEHKVEVKTNMTFDESVEMGIGHDAIPMVIERLISAYNFPELAVLREYTSNAYDVHVEHNVQRPVEVTLPSGLAPNLTIRDFGPGLSREELKGFGQFGESTKRKSNAYTGGFGLGSKSALAIASQFIVTSIKNGRRNTVVIARDDENRPHMNFMEEVDSDAESGTMITVPMASADRLGDLSTFFLGWKPGSILVDDEQPKYSLYDPARFRSVGGGIAWHDLNYVASSRDMVRIVINQVYYTLDYKKMDLTYKQREALKYYIIKIDNGSVKIAPSREDLIYNRATREALQARMNEVLTIAARDRQKAIQDAPDPLAAVKLAMELEEYGFSHDVAVWKGKRVLFPGDTFQGNRIPDPQGTWANPQKAGTKTGWMVEKTMAGISRLNISHRARWPQSAPKFVIIHGANPAVQYRTGSSYRWAHAEAHLVNDWLTVKDPKREENWTIFITDEPLNRINYWFREAADVIVSADDFNADAKGARSKREAAEKAGATKKDKSLLKVLTNSYYGTPDTAMVTVSDIKKDYKKIIILRNEELGLAGVVRSAMLYKKYYNSAIAGGARGIVARHEAAMILVNKNDDLTDLLPLLPTVVTFEELVLSELANSVSSYTELERMAIRDRGRDGVSFFTHYLDSSTLNLIKRKKTREWAETVRTFTDKGANERAALAWAGLRNRAMQKALEDAGSPVDTSNLPASPLKRYPLVPSVYNYRENRNALIEYINLVDSAKKA